MTVYVNLSTQARGDAKFPAIARNTREESAKSERTSIAYSVAPDYVTVQDHYPKYANG